MSEELRETVTKDRDRLKRYNVWLDGKWEEARREKYALEERIERAIRKALRPNLPDTEDEEGEEIEEATDVAVEE